MDEKSRADIEYKKDALAHALNSAWIKYVEIFGVDPHGTVPQLRALIEFAHIEDII